jgi:hypothetical protein
VRSIVVHDIPLDDIAAMERWYHRYHAPEIVRRYGPWLVRHESYLPVTAPAEAHAYGLFNWRVTDGWWRSLPTPGAQGALSFSDPPVKPRVATCFVPWQPDDDFLGADGVPDSHQCLRWLQLLRYPDGVSREQGDQWFVNNHAPEVMRQPGLTRFFSYRCVREGVHLPGSWARGSIPSPGMVTRDWDRVVELWYGNFRDWRRAVISSPPQYTAPAWATNPAYPFLKPGQHFVSSFLLERPNDEFLRDSRIFLA